MLKQRTTNQRQLILDYVQSTTLHPTAEQIFNIVRKKMPRISFGTVYRNLDVLEKQGLLKSLCYSKEPARYDAIIDNHYHFVCERCGKIKDLVIDEMLELNDQAAKRHSLSISRHSIMFYGMCGECEEYLQKQKDE
ncbi:MAG: transcriptional repressor [Parcubacteria group bacterium]